MYQLKDGTTSFSETMTYPVNGSLTPYMSTDLNIGKRPNLGQDQLAAKFECYQIYAQYFTISDVKLLDLPGQCN